MFSFFKKKQNPSPAPVQQSLVVPRIKLTSFIEDIQGSLKEGYVIPEDQLPITESLVGDLLLTYANDTGNSFEMITPHTLSEFSADDRSQLRALAENNAIEVLKKVRMHVAKGGVLYKLSCGENMEACAILFPSLWRQIVQDELESSPLIAAFVHRDMVLYAKNDSAGKQALMDEIAKTEFDDRHALSKKIYEFTGQGWKVAVD
jgi:uncharacterized protein YtpQ (UPF0354 family)